MPATVRVGLALLWLSSVVVIGATAMWAEAISGRLDTLPFPLGENNPNRTVRALAALGSWYAEDAFAVDRAAVVAALSDFPLRVGLFVAAVAALITLLVGHPRTRAGLRGFFTTPGSPIDLGVFRFAFYIFLFLWVHTTEASYFAALSPDLMFGLRDPLPVWRVLVPDPALMAAAIVVFRVSCVLAIIGLWTRGATIAVAVSVFYVMGIPQVFGKANHLHHLLWIAVIFATSRCGDAFSVDALLAARRRADRGLVSPPGPSVAHALPLRFVWLIVGVAYFFPGVWKLMIGGVRWASSDHLANQMRVMWYQDPGFEPLFRADLQPTLLTLAAAGTLVFELSAPFFLLFRRTLWVTPAMGLMFHNMTNALMGISFIHMQGMYLSMIPWARAFRWLGRVGGRAPLTVAYDSQASPSRRSAALLATLDLTGGIDLVDARASSDGEGEGEGADGGHRLWIRSSQGALLPGVEAFRSIARRVPLLWPLRPLMAVPPLAAAVRGLYARITDGDGNTGQAARPEVAARAAAPPTARAVMVAGIIILGGALVYGLARKVSGYPFACYPTFDVYTPSSMEDVFVMRVGPDGTEELVPDVPLRARLSPSRVTVMKQHILAERDPRAQAQQLWSYWTALQEASGNPQKAGKVRFYRGRTSLIPEEQDHLDRESLSLLDEREVPR